jgi:glycine dehydrogenase
VTAIDRPSYDDLANHGAFIERHIGPSSADQLRMLEVLGYSSLDELTSAAIPSTIERLGALSIGSVSYTHLTLPTSP